MPIADLCSNRLICVEKSSSLQHAAHLMKQHHVGGVVVVESNGSAKPVGVLTDRDIVLGVVAENLPLTTRVEDVMSREVAKISMKKGIAEAVDHMEAKGVRRMIVVDDVGNACGLVSADDILQLVARELNGLGRIVDKQLNNERRLRPDTSQMMI